MMLDEPGNHHLDRKTLPKDTEKLGDSSDREQKNRLSSLLPVTQEFGRHRRGDCVGIRSASRVAT